MVGVNRAEPVVHDAVDRDVQASTGPVHGLPVGGNDGRDVQMLVGHGAPVSHL